MASRERTLKQNTAHLETLLRAIGLGEGGRFRRAWIEHDYLHVEWDWDGDGDPPPGYYVVAVGGMPDNSVISVRTTTGEPAPGAEPITVMQVTDGGVSVLEAMVVGP